MKVVEVETFVVDGGRRPWFYSAVRTDEGLTGYGEFGSWEFPRGLPALVQDLAEFVIGRDPTAVDKIWLDMYRATRQAPYGATTMAMAGIELALWDLKGKSLGRSRSSVAGRAVPRAAARVLVALGVVPGGEPGTVRSEAVAQHGGPRRLCRGGRGGRLHGVQDEPGSSPASRRA